MRPPDPPDFDLYETLEVSPHASPETIDAAWKVLLRKHHPDLARRGSGEVAAKRINIAHDWLSDPVLRARYDAIRPDRTGRAGPASDRSSFRPATFRTAAQAPPAGTSRTPAQARPVSPAPTATAPRSSAATNAPRTATAAARSSAATSVPSGTPRSSTATSAPSDMPRTGTARRRSTPRGLAFVVAILIGMLAGLLYLAPLVFGPKPPPTSPPRTPAPSRTSGVTKTAIEPGIVATSGESLIVRLPGPPEMISVDYDLIRPGESNATPRSRRLT